ncbi:AAA family ATPase [Cobetia sp. cqz5-12]|uniref:DEAD/DEAH box helicase n=1 Tax=Cobetia sp. cqz5-12 TaxID=2609415 RepID=UPI0019083748|nr:ATP-binding domain-containing protein [Cobetia sp. cqz5-12]QQK63915.1 AAA family ATPase [Cobetia sp. cqz5-12]
MSSSWFYLQAEKNNVNSKFIDELQEYAGSSLEQVYVIDKPLGESKYEYDYKDALVVLIPKKKILFIDFGDNEESFGEFVEDFLEDLGYISDKYNYKKILGRPKKWQKEIVVTERGYPDGVDIVDFLERIEINNLDIERKCELVVSLLTGSINDVDRLGEVPPESTLDIVKQKIQLFDGDQTRFIYQTPADRVTTIQGLSGTGKTELLLHKLKEVYTSTDSSRIMLTCHNRILASNLKERVPTFFDFMKVEHQILWNKRLWCVHGWGSGRDKNSGAYSYICDFYKIPFHVYSKNFDFDDACKAAVSLIRNKIEEYGTALDFILIDESQDFPESFFELCELITKESVYIAGDIFQSIFDTKIISEVTPDFLLSKCYRTDPRTLMFAHGLGMGLFEEKKLRWLDEEEWKACGYIYDECEDGDSVVLSRAPLRRFEDLVDRNETSVEIVDYSNHSDVIENITGAIEQIRIEHPTVEPGDIGVIFIHPSRMMYNLADRLQLAVDEKFDWPTNKAYESKIHLRDELFVSNQNNVKGLEFPFVICVAGKITKGSNFRNALYMMLTRSFLKTYLVISEGENSEVLPRMHAALSEINETEKMIISKPREEDILKTTIDYQPDNMSLYDTIESICNEYSASGVQRKMAHEMVDIYRANHVITDFSTYEEIKGVIKSACLLGDR